MKRRSWQTELPHIGDLPGGTSGARKASIACSAWASLQREARTRSSRPERPCVDLFHWSIASSTVSGCAIAIASLCATGFSALSVTTIAISMIRSTPGFRPVISMSTQIRRVSSGAATRAAGPECA